MKKYITVLKPLIILLVITFPIIFASIIMLEVGNISFYYTGFAVDSEGTVYIGRENTIACYKNGEYVNSIKIKTSNYAFTVDENDNIIIAKDNKVVTMNQNGVTLNIINDTEHKTFYELKKLKYSYKSSNGSSYYMKNILGRYCIYNDNNESVYKMPLLDYILKYSLIILYLALAVVAVIIIYKYRFGKNAVKNKW